MIEETPLLFKEEEEEAAGILHSISLIKLQMDKGRTDRDFILLLYVLMMNVWTNE